MGEVTLESPLLAVLGSGARKLAKARDLVTVRDLLDYFPRRYIDAHAGSTFGEFELGEHVVLTARVETMTQRRMQTRKGSMANAVIVDDEGRRAAVTFFSAQPHYNVLRPGKRALFSGQLGLFNKQLQLSHPQYTLMDDADMSVYPGSLVPVYKQVEKITNLNLTLSISTVLDALGEIPDPLDEPLRARHGLVTTTRAYRGLHLPASMADVQAGRERLRFDEAFTTQIVLAQRRHEARSEPSTPRVAKPGGLLERFDATLPFELTEGQREVGEQIARDLAEPVAMHRLLQGEVGSGKTLVALRAMLAVVDSGAQAALLAPTEVLAAQHAASMRAMLGPLAERGRLGGADDGTRVTLLTGSMSASARTQALLDIVSGEAGIVIGTHALLQKHVEFADLGLVVVDEQHRFGVEQRAALSSKAHRPPHVLVMTATPIPRTVAMTAFGDLDVSTLRQLPRGRAPIVSHVVPTHVASWMNRVWERIAEECGAGRQVYVVAGRIGDGSEPVAPGLVDGPDAHGAGEGDAAARPIGVVDLIDEMRRLPALAGLRIGLMHGRLPAEEKDDVMRRFGAGEVDVLVATTVIEVGVDVPNASMIVIVDADRFGLSQLHQLRGRVGRGEHGGLCLLVTRNENPDTLERLRRVAETNDGFAIADLDLDLRREGDVLGAAQSGRRSSLDWLELTKASDLAVIEAARTEAAAIVEADPSLTEHPLLAQAAHARVDASQAEFLERS